MIDREKILALGVPPVVAEALERFRLSSEAEKDQRQSILAAKNFRALNQWPDEVKIQRQGGPAIQGVAAQPPRPCLTVDRISQPVRQVSNSVKQADFSMEVVPNGGGASKEVAEILKGWMRRVQNDARADAPIEWAADGAAEGGLGWFRLRADYCTDDPNDPYFDDQDLKLERVANSLSVYADPNAVKPMKSDGKFLFVTANLAKDEFRRRWPKADFSTLDAFRATGDGDGWVTDDTIRIAEYWRVEYDEVRVVRTVDGRTLKGDAAKGLTKEEIKTDRLIQTPIVRWSKITAAEELESGVWLGTRIPFIPIQGEELNVDGKTVRRGVIQPAMDAQRMTNYTYSAAIEVLALQPKSPIFTAEGSFESYRNIYATMNTFNYANIPYAAYDKQGRPLPPPARQQVEAPIGAMVEMIVRSEEAVKVTTETFDSSLGKREHGVKSGKQTLALQKQSEFAKSGYLEQVKNSMIYAGDLMVEIAPKILDRPGRPLQILGVDDKPEQVILGQPFVPGQDGQAEALPEDDPRVAEGIAKFYDLKKGRYSVTVSIGQSYTTRREEGAAMMGELIPHLPPPMAAALTPKYIETLDIPEAQEMADIARRALPPELQESEDGKPPQIPPALQAQMQQMTAVIQQQGQLIQELKSGVAVAQIKEQGATEREKIAAAKDLQIQAMRGQVDLTKTAATVDQKQAEAMIDAETKRFAAVLNDQGSVRETIAASDEAARDRAHERASDPSLTSGEN